MLKLEGRPRSHSHGVARSLSDVAATAQRNWRSGLGSSELIDDVAAESFRIDRSGMTMENMQWPLMD